MISSKDLEVKNNKNVIDLMREILELEQVVKNTMVLLVNYQNNLFYLHDKKNVDISFLDLKFSPIMIEFLAIHNKILEKINSNDLKLKEVKNE